MEVTDHIQSFSFNYNQQYDTFLKYLTKKPLINIATLGPLGTSSEVAAKYLLSMLNGKNGNYTLFPTYEEAFKDCTEGKSNVLLVANAYERIDRIYMSQEIEFVFPFVFETPLYGVGKNKNSTLSKNQPLKLASHHAPASLIPWFLTDITFDYEITFVRSTSEAAIKVQTGEVDLCVTTEHAAKQYGVEFISKTRPILMLWSVFIRR